ncbi:Gfo/Idh/MocA family protein [Cognatishimia maritima]|uniref:Predicted dehydrogenase n=1 Tax=Cognatishimia maritima TaxID=870908 RepID=A0A1M5N7R1_9RHOB|nr:Gfo/Idh/MocA family oxidoreductase [Cognatishimia maritima]SHG85580.1 Predicted dehydrogenase [Cognatishimia maritima]
MTRKLRLGMVGGGQGAFIGDVHRMAARLDGEWELVAGALSSDPARAMASARDLGLAPDRSYASFEDMAKTEAARPDGIDAVAIVTPNHMHAAPCIAFLRQNIHVICDKPLTATLEQAAEIAKAAQASTAQFFLTHNYTGYPLIRQARDMVKAGDLGDIRLVQVEYAQDWLTEEVSNKQADWRTDPARSGAGGCVGDIGTHAYNIARFVSGLTVESLSAELTSFVPGRALDDNVQAKLRFAGSARGSLWASQVAVGNENGLRLRIYGSKAGLDWAQENPNVMTFTRFGEAKQILTRGGAVANDSNHAAARVPAGHPEGYLEGFANLYRDAAAAIRAQQDNKSIPVENLVSLEDGLDGMRFIQACVQSSENNGAWTRLADV